MQSKPRSPRSVFGFRRLSKLLFSFSLSTRISKLDDPNFEFDTRWEHSGCSIRQSLGAHSFTNVRFVLSSSYWIDFSGVTCLRNGGDDGAGRIDGRSVEWGRTTTRLNYPWLPNGSKTLCPMADSDDAADLLGLQEQLAGMLAGKLSLLTHGIQG